MSKGKKNAYTCPQGHKTITIDVDDGVTPFMILCNESGEHKDCNEFAKSSFYSPILQDQSVVPTMEWYKPSDEEYDKMKEGGEKDHVKMGGLLLRKINKT